MSYVGAPFDFDIFFSYSHGSDSGGKAYLQAWSTAFANELERELRADRKFRNSLSIFLDNDHRDGQGIDPMSPLTEQLRQKIGSSAILLLLMSPDYLASSWCADERNWWIAQQKELGLAREDRIAVVKIWPTEDPWPEALNDSRGHPMVGFDFYNGKNQPARPYGWREEPGPFSREFDDALLSIVGRLYSRLADIKVRAESLRREAAEREKLAAQAGQVIYLHGRSDNRDAWQQAALELTNKGFVVLPGEPDPVAKDPQSSVALREQRVQILSDCDALLLLGTGDSRAVDQDLLTIGRNDRQSARGRSNRLLPCGLLDTVGPDLGTPVRRDNARNLQVDWIDGTKAPWIPAVHQWITSKGAMVPA